MNIFQHLSSFISFKNFKHHLIDVLFLFSIFVVVVPLTIVFRIVNRFIIIIVVKFIFHCLFLKK